MLSVALLGEPASAGSFLAQCPASNGPGTVLSVETTAPSRPRCTVTPLPVDAASVLAAVPAPRRPPGAPDPEAVTIQGIPGNTGFEIRDVTFAPTSLSAPPPYLVPGADLRSILSAGVMGPLGRATLTRDGDQTLLDCTAGNERAGLLFATARVPPISGMAIRIVHTAEHSFHLVVSRPGAPAGEALPVLAKLRAADNPTEAHFVLPPDLPADTPLDFAVLCPTSGGRLALNEIVLEAKTAVPSERRAWVRDAMLWQKLTPQVFARAQRWDLTRLSVRVPLRDGTVADPQALAGFIATASARGIGVWALLTDGEAGGANTGALARDGAALADYNAAVSRDAQLRGVEVEQPAGRLWNYVPDVDSEAHGLLDRLQSLRPILGMPLVAMVPARFPTGPGVAERMASLLDGLTVITDRTEPAEIRRSVARFLAWGTRRNRPVEVALEVAPLPDRERGRYLRADTGELWLVPMDDREALILLKEPASKLPGKAFRQVEAAPVPPESRSFNGRRAELRETLAPLGRTLGVWPSFAGFAFHGLFPGRE